MKIKNNRSGFTLLEIIIVIIIVGVLASLALPRLFKTINYAKATEALNIMSTAKRGVDRCALSAGADTGAPVFTNCDTWVAIGLDDPVGIPGSKFTYAWTGFAADIIILTATGIAPLAGTIVMNYDTAAGAITRSGTLDFSAIN